MHTPSAAQLRGGRQTTRVFPPCEIAAQGSAVVRAKILSWGNPGSTVLANNPAKVERALVSLQVLESLRGNLSGAIAAYVVGPFDPASGRFLDGQLAQNEEVYVSIKVINSEYYILPMGFWPIASVDGGNIVSSDSRGVDETAFRAQVGRVAVCPISAMPPSTPPYSSWSPDGSVVSVVPVMLDGGE